MGHRLYFAEDQDYYWLNYERASRVSAALESMQLCHAYLSTHHRPARKSYSCSSAAAVVAALPSYMVQTATKTSSSSAVAVIVALGDDGALYLSFLALSETERNS